MKILIPFSGGVNSTYSLYRWLTETDVDIVARFAYERWEVSGYKKNLDEEIKNVNRILQICRKIRDFKFEFVEWSMKYEEKIVPIRDGFKLGTYNIGAIAPRYEGFYQWIKETNVGGFSFGISLENSATDHGYLGTKKLHQRKIVENAGADIYLAGTKDLSPVPIGDDFDPDVIIKELSGRFEQYEFLPNDIKKLILKCDRLSCTDEDCKSCMYWRAYDYFISIGKTGRDFDLYCARMGSYGSWRHEADPETYFYRGHNAGAYNRKNYLKVCNPIYEGLITWE